MSDFSTEIVDAVLHHMNDDHNDDNLLIAQAFGSTEAWAATMVGLDGRGGTWSYLIGDDEREVTVPWSAEISERAEIRREIVVLYDKACAILGVPARPHE